MSSTDAPDLTSVRAKIKYHRSRGAEGPCRGHPTGRRLQLARLHPAPKRATNPPSRLSVSRMGERDLDLTLVKVGRAAALARDAYGEQERQRVGVRLVEVVAAGNI